MQIVDQEYVPAFPLADVVPDPENPWAGDDEGVGESIDALGFYGAILLQAGTHRIIAGHTRVRQAQARGAATVPALVVAADDLWQARALVGDNRTNQRGRFVDEPLARVLERLKSADALTGTGFADDDLQATIRRLDKAARSTHIRRAVRPAETPEGTAEVIRGDARTLDGIADESVDLIVTSPPFFALRSYRDGGEHYDGQIGSEPSPEEFLEALWACTATWWRKLKPTGSLWVNLGDKYAGSAQGGAGEQPSTTLDGGPMGRWVGAAGEQGVPAPTTDVRPKSLIGVPWRYAIGCIDGKAAPGGQRWILRAEVVWSKLNGLPESVTDRVRRSHEQWFHFTKQERYFAAIDEVREPQTSTDVPKGETPESDYWRRSGKTDYALGRQELGWDVSERVYNPLGRVPGSVWSIPSEPLIVPDGYPEHFAAFPQEWPRRIILGWSPSAWCDGCGEPRRPVVEKSATGQPRTDHALGGRHESAADQMDVGNRDVCGRNEWANGVRREVIGYECGCDDPDAPTSASVVLDPFGGTGTTAMVARALGRHGVSVDLSADYCRLAKWRIFESGHWQKSIDQTRNPELIEDEDGEAVGA